MNYAADLLQLRMPWQVRLAHAHTHTQAGARVTLEVASTDIEPLQKW